MDAYCVIHFKDKEEKKQILNLLVDTEVEFKVTADLKKYVIEKFNLDSCKCCEGVGKNIVVDVVPPTIDNIHGQHTDIQPPNAAGAQAHQPVDNQQELLNINNIGTLVPYRDRMIQPKKEVIDVEEYTPTVDELAMEVIKEEDTPERVSKRLNDKTITPMKHVKKARIGGDERRMRSCVRNVTKYEDDDDTEETEVRPKDPEDRCNICSKNITGLGMNNRQVHIFSHLDFMLYQCIEPGCKFATKYQNGMSLHMGKSHKKVFNVELNRIKLSKKEEKKIEDMMKKCFPTDVAQQEDIDYPPIPLTFDKPGVPPNMESTNRFTCQKCGTKNLMAQCLRIAHAAGHAGVDRLICSACNFKSNHYSAVNQHISVVHKGAKVVEVELSKEQNRKLRKMVKECYPREAYDDDCQVMSSDEPSSSSMSVHKEIVQSSNSSKEPKIATPRKDYIDIN